MIRYIYDDKEAESEREQDICQKPVFIYFQPLLAAMRAIKRYYICLICGVAPFTPPYASAAAKIYDIFRRFMSRAMPYFPPIIIMPPPPRLQKDKREKRHIMLRAKEARRKRYAQHIFILFHLAQRYWYFAALRDIFAIRRAPRATKIFKDAWGGAQMSDICGAAMMRDVFAFFERHCHAFMIFSFARYAWYAFLSSMRGRRRRRLRRFHFYLHYYYYDILYVFMLALLPYFSFSARRRRHYYYYDIRRYFSYARDIFFLYAPPCHDIYIMIWKIR